jgi:high-affinity iron transporter
MISPLWNVALRFVLALGLAAAWPIAHANAAAPTAEVQTTWRLLDYLAVDYAGAVAGGR